MTVLEPPMRKIKPLIVMMAVATSAAIAHAEQQDASSTQSSNGNAKQLSTITVVASADASAEGLMPAFAGGQVASGGKVGIFGNQKNIDTPFNLTSYTNQYIQERQAESVGDVLQADSAVRTAKGFGNFQEAYFYSWFCASF